MTNINTFTMSVAEIRANWQMFDYHLSFERESVWTLKRERSFIEGLLRGYSPPEFPVVRIGKGFALVDGTQRFITLRRFLEDKFTTFKAKQNPPYGSLDPNKTHSQLLSNLKSKMDLIPFRFYELAEMAEWELANYYRWLQYQQTLLLSESVWTYPSQTKQQAIKLLDHDFWRDIYGGNHSRMRPFLGCYYLMLIEASSSEVNITERRLREFASGVDDNAVNSQLIEKISGRLSTANHVFHGTVLKDVKEIIPVYETVGIVDSLNFNITEVEKGCLTNWYKQVQEQALSDRQKYGIRGELFRLTSVNYRQSFRDKQTDAIIEAVKLKRKSKLVKTTLPLDINEVVYKQDGLCRLCDRKIENVLGGDYVLQYKNDAQITLDNCAVVHKACDQKLRQSMPYLDLTSIEIKGGEKTGE